jgi:hypothetical protein
MKEDGIRNIVVVGDAHCGSTTGLLPPGCLDDDGQPLGLSPLQRWLWVKWEDFWEWAYGTIGPHPFAFVFLGDACDGRHHGTTQLVSANIAVQQAIAMRALAPIVKRATRSFFIRGTEAHVGQAAETEETLAKSLLHKEHGTCSQFDLWIKMGRDTIHFAHHIATTTSAAYKSSPLMRLMAAAFAAAGEHNFKAPNIMVRGHCHDFTGVQRPRHRVVTCPSWQGKTAHVWKFSTVEPVVVGGLIIRRGDDGVHIRERLYTQPQPRVVRL